MNALLHGRRRDRRGEHRLKHDQLRHRRARLGDGHTRRWAIAEHVRVQAVRRLAGEDRNGADPKMGWVRTLGYRGTGRRQSESYVRRDHLGTTTGGGLRGPLCQQPATVYCAGSPLAASTQRPRQVHRMRNRRRPFMEVRREWAIPAKAKQPSFGGASPIWSANMTIASAGHHELCLGGHYEICEACKRLPGSPGGLQPAARRRQPPETGPSGVRYVWGRGASGGPGVAGAVAALARTDSIWGSTMDSGVELASRCSTCRRGSVYANWAKQMCKVSARSSHRRLREAIRICGRRQVTTRRTFARAVRSGLPGE